MSEFEYIKEYDGIYKINKNGDVLCCKFGEKPIKIRYNHDGYKICVLNQKSKFIHRLLAIQFIPNDDLTKNEVDHIDRNRTNNDLANLRWVNRTEQTRNRMRNGCISIHKGFRKNGEQFINYRGSYTIPDETGKMKIVRKSSCIDIKIVEDWLNNIKEQYP